MSIVVHKNYNELFSLNNIFLAWQKFRRGKTTKVDVMAFEMHLEDNLFALYEDLSFCQYKHSAYTHFQIFDSKKRDIYKARVRDRVVHQIVYDYLLALFEKEFISDSYSSRLNKGQYKAIDTFRYFLKLAENNKNPPWVLKCDVRKYFDNIDQSTLFGFLKEKIVCEKTRYIIQEIINSYVFSKPCKGIPLGNITSQIFANIYLNILDKYAKETLHCRFYVRYNDDFVIVSDSVEKLAEIRGKIILFVKEKLFLDIPLEKTSIRKVCWGIDFLGFTILPKAILLRDKTKGKMFKNINPNNMHSYFGILKHCHSYKLKKRLFSLGKLNDI